MGFLRLFLALCVIAGHSGTTVFGFRGIGAWYAVQFFFAISGFYMAMVLNENKTYKDSSILFYKSRFLRLFPVYYIGLLLGIIVSFFSILSLFNNLTFSSKIFYIFQNLFIFGQDLSYLICSPLKGGSCASPVALSINPPAWSLAVELGFYLIAPLFLKNLHRTFLLFIIGFSTLLYVNLHFPNPFITYDFFRPLNLTVLNYYYYPSSFIFFTCGALGYFLIYKKQYSPFLYPLALLSILGLSFVKTVMPFWHLIFIAISIPIIFGQTKNNKIDRIIGELSYPAYILHFPIIIFLRKFQNSDKTIWLNLTLGTWVAIFSCLLGIILWYFVDKRINLYRHKKLQNNKALNKMLNPKLFTLLYGGGDNLNFILFLTSKKSIYFLQLNRQKLAKWNFNRTKWIFYSQKQQYVFKRRRSIEI